MKDTAECSIDVKVKVNLDVESKVNLQCVPYLLKKHSLIQNSGMKLSLSIVERLNFYCFEAQAVTIFTKYTIIATP